MDGSFANNSHSPGSDRSRNNWDASSSSGAGAWASESSVSEKEHSPENKHHVTFVDKVEDIDVASHRTKPPPPKVPTRSDSLKHLNKPSMMKQASPLPTRKLENSGYLVNKPLGSPTDVPTHSIFPSSPDNENPVDQTKKIPTFEDGESYQQMKSRMENPSIKNEVPVQMEAHSMKHHQIHTPIHSQKPLHMQKVKSSESKTSASRQHSQPKVQHPIQSSLNNKVGARLFDPYDENRHSVVLTQRDTPAATDAETAKNLKTTPTVIDAKPEKRPGTPGADTTPEKKSKDQSIKKSGSTSSYVKLNSLDEDDIDMVVLAGYGAEDRKETDVSQHHQEPQFHKAAEVAEQIHAGRRIELANNVVNQDPHPHKTEQMYEYQRIQQYNHEKENELVQDVEKQDPYQQIPSPGHSGYSPISESDDNPSSGIYSGADNKFLQIGARLFDYLDPNRLSAAFEANQNIKNQHQQPEPIAINNNSNAIPGRSNEDDNNNNNNNSTSVPSTPGYQDRYFNENSVSFLVGSDEAVNLGKRSFDHIKEHAFLDEPENKPLMMGGDYYDMNKLIKANARLSEGSIPDEFSADTGFESYEAIMETILNEIKLNNRFSMEILQEDGDELYELAQNIQSGKISSQTDTVRSLPEQEYQHQEVIAQQHYGSMPFKVAMTEEEEKQWSQNELEYIEEENIEREPQREEAHEEIYVIETGAPLQANTGESEDADYDLLTSETHEIKDPSEEVEAIKTNPHFEVSSSRVQFYDQAPQVINLNHLKWFQINPLNTIQEASPRNSTVLSEDSSTTATQKTERETTKKVQLLETEYIVKTKEIHEEIIIPLKNKIGQSKPIEGSNSIEIKSDNTYELLNYEVNQIPDIDTVDSKVEEIQEEQKHQEEIHQNRDVQELIKQEISKEVAKEVGQKVVDEVYQQVLHEQTTERMQQLEDQSMKTPTVIRSLYATWPDVSVEGVSEVSQPEDITEACEAEEVEEDPEKGTEHELDQEVPIDDKQFYQSSLLVHLNLGEGTSEEDPNAHGLNDNSGSDRVSEVTHISRKMVPKIEDEEEVCLENPIQAADHKADHKDDSGYSEAPGVQRATEVFEVLEVPKIYSVTQLQNITEIEIREVRRPPQVELFRTVPIGDIREVSKIYDVPVVESYPQLQDRRVSESGKDRDIQNEGPVPQIEEIRQSRDELEDEGHNGAKDSPSDVGSQDDEFPPPPEEDDLSRLLEENENIRQESKEEEAEKEEEDEEKEGEEEGDGEDEKESHQNPQDQYYELQQDQVLEKGLELQEDLQQDLERDVQLLNEILQTERQASQPHDHKTDQNVQLPLETLAQQKHSQEDQHLEQLTDSKLHQPQNQQQSQVDQQQMEQEYHISQQANQERQYQLMQQQTEVKQRAQQERPEIQQSQQQTQEKQQQMQQEQEEKLPEDQQQTQEDLLLLQQQYQQKQKQYQQMQLQIQQNQQQLQAQQQLQSKKSPSSPLQSPTSPKRRFQPTSKSIMEEYHTQKKTDTVGDHLVASRLCDYDDENRLSYVFQQPRQDQDSSTSADKVNAPYANVKLSPVSEVASPQSLALQMAKQRQESATLSKRHKENTLNPHSPNRKIVPLQMPSVSEQPKNKNENQLSEHQDISAEQSSLNGNQQPLSYEDILQKHNQRLADLMQQQKSNENGTQQKSHANITQHQKSSGKMEQHQKSHAHTTQHQKSSVKMSQHQKSSAQQDKSDKYVIQSNKYATLPTHFKKDSIQSDRMPKRSASQRSPSQQHYQPLSQTLPLNKQRQIQFLSHEQQDHMAPVKQQQKLGNIKNVSNTSLESKKMFPLMPVIEKVGTRLSDYDDVNRFSMIMSKQLKTT